MSIQTFYSNCSREYIDGLDPRLHQEITDLVCSVPIRAKQAEINRGLFWLFTRDGWSYDTTRGAGQSPPEGLGLDDLTLQQVEARKDRSLCLTTTTIDASWYSDFAKVVNGHLIQIETQFGKVEAMFKDFYGFKIAYYERRLSLGIEVVISKPQDYFSHRQKSVSGMAYFEIAKKTLPAIELGCPIWLIGIERHGH